MTGLRMKFAGARRSMALGFLALLISGCSSLGSNGPSSRAVLAAGKRSVDGSPILVVDLNQDVARRAIMSSRHPLLSELLGDGQLIDAQIMAGDILDISIWEAPPAALFGTMTADARTGTAGGSAVATAIARNSQLPEQTVDNTGNISVPFVGPVKAVGRSTQQIEREIAVRLRGIAHQPQVIVRRVRNAAAGVTVVGDVTNSSRVPLTAKGERLLEVLASAGGVKQPVGKTTIQITRGDKLASLPLDEVIRDPQQNIRLQAGDIVTAYFQPYSFIALGASGLNAEVNFEGTGITLAQSLGRIGGLRDDRANNKGVFIFRLEDPSALPAELRASARLTPDGKAPVIYRVNLSDPASFFVAQGFPIRNKDVLYVSNAPGVDFQKFVSLVSSLAITGLSITSTVP